MPQSNKLHIICSTDENYAPYCGVMLTSVFQNNPKADAYVLIKKELSKTNFEKFKKIEQQYHTRINFINIADSSLYSLLPRNTGTKWPIESYFRLFSAELLPDSFERALYLDCDIIVNGDLTSFYNSDFLGHSTIVVPDIQCGNQDIYSKRAYLQKPNYFSAGVLLINLKYWRENKVLSQCLEYINRNELLEYADQDVLNYVLNETVIYSSVSTNYQLGFLFPVYFNLCTSQMQKEIITYFHNPLIIHYNQNKPWFINYYNYPFNNLWHYYKKSSPFSTKKDIIPKRKKVNYIVKRYLLWPLGLMNKTGLIGI